MRSLLLALVFAGAFEWPETTFGSEPDQSIAVVASGAPGRDKQQGDKILDRLGVLVCARHPLLVAWFDAEPTPQRGFATRNADRRLIKVTTRTPMRDTMAIGLAALSDTSCRRAMVVVAREQFYPTDVPMSQILEQARLAATPIYTIHLASANGDSHGSRGAAHIAGNLFTQAFERLVIHQRAYSERETLRQLNLLSGATGGWACQEEDESSAVACAAEIAGRIKER